MSDERNWRVAETQDSLQSIDAVLNQRAVALTLLYHPDLERIGEVARMPGLRLGKTAAISRLDPIFAHPGSSQGSPIADARISRRPVWLEPAAGGGIRVAWFIVLFPFKPIALSLGPVVPQPAAARSSAAAANTEVVLFRRGFCRMCGLHLPAISARLSQERLAA